jgi:hypothetical protein
MDKIENRGRGTRSNFFNVMNELELHIAFLNSYEVIINGIPPETITNTDVGIFIHNPSLPARKKDVEDLLKYFEETEDYDKCIKIKSYLNEKTNSSRT